MSNLLLRLGKLMISERPNGETYYLADEADATILELRAQVENMRQALELARSHIREHDDHAGDCALSQSDGDHPCSCDYGFTLVQIDASLPLTERCGAK